MAHCIDCGVASEFTRCPTCADIWRQENAPTIEEKPWKWIAVIDEHTCDVCKELHEALLSPGVPMSSLPPHPECKNPDGCRCMAERSKY